VNEEKINEDTIWRGTFSQNTCVYIYVYIRIYIYIYMAKLWCLLAMGKTTCFGL